MVQTYALDSLTRQLGLVPLADAEARSTEGGLFWFAVAAAILIAGCGDSPVHTDPTPFPGTEV